MDTQLWYTMVISASVAAEVRAESLFLLQVGRAMWCSRFFFLLVSGCILAAGVCATPATAQQFGRNKVQYDSFDFNERLTDHFRILYYERNEPVVDDLSRMSERWYQRLSGVFRHEFEEGERKPLIFYADDADFQQTNVLEGFVPEGVRGATEPRRERVVMPLQPIPNVTHHVLGHELVHSFQFDIGLRTSGFRTDRLPLWLVEGMAEYYSLGRYSPNTAMWMRDAALREELPTVDEMTQAQAFDPYRYGQSITAYIAGTYGDETLADVFRAAGELGVEAGLSEVLGVSAEELTAAWHEAIRDELLPPAEGRTPPEEVGRRVLAADLGHGELNVGPALSPDGRYVSFLSDRDLFNIDVFVADAETGEVITNLGTVAQEPHLDAIRFITSSGSWSPDGERVAFIAYQRGDNVLAIWNVDTGRIERRIAVEEAPALENPAWAPGGDRIVVSGLSGGTSDLYVVNLEDGDVEQLTDDAHAALQPVWSPGGETIAYATDAGPGGTDLETLDYRPMRIGLLDVESRAVDYFQPFGEDVVHHDPQFSPDGQSLFFIASPDGFIDVYRHDIQEEATYRVTEVQTGVSGITDLAPALTVAAQSGEMMFSIFSENQYSVVALEPEETEGTPVEDTAGLTADAAVLPPASAFGEDVVASYLASPTDGLPEIDPAIEDRDFTSRLALSAVLPPQAGIGIGGGFGTQVSGGVGFLFSDLLENHNLMAVVQAQGTFRDIGGQLSYINRGQRFNYGASVGRTPLIFQQAFTEIGEEEAVINRLIQRIHIDQGYLLGEYPLSMTRRFEGAVGVSRYGYGLELERFRVDPLGRVLDRERTRDEDELAEFGFEVPEDEYFGVGSLAYVIDFSFFGFTAPIQGGRSRYEVAPRIGEANYVTLLADTRRYLRAAPFTLAMRALHLGNWGADLGERFSTEYLGSPYQPGYLRGYDFSSFVAEECPQTQQECPAMDRLVGTHVAMASAEVRLPFLGNEQLGLISFPWVPTDLNLFADGGVAWTSDDLPTLDFEQDTNERVPVFSAGASGRFNILGALVLEIYYAYPFQRPERGGHFGWMIMPGW